MSERHLVTVTVSGLTKSGKSAVCGEIEIALKAIGLVVNWQRDYEEKHLTGADWGSVLDTYKPEILIKEVNIARSAPEHFDPQVIATGKMHDCLVSADFMLDCLMNAIEKASQRYQSYPRSTDDPKVRSLRGEFHQLIAEAIGWASR